MCVTVGVAGRSGDGLALSLVVGLIEVRSHSLHDVYNLHNAGIGVVFLHL